MTLQISPLAKERVGNAILISGSGRSGTTIMGKLLHSFQDVEYVFEPPMLISLMPLIQTLDEHSWKLLYETYLYEEFFINALSGRGINTNQADDSSIYAVKTEYQIQRRLTHSIRKAEAEALGRQGTIAYKMPNIIPYIPRLLQYYPETRVLIMKRDAVSTINSLLEKEWFSNESMEASKVWPYKICKGIHVPSWIKEGDEEKWLSLSEIDRCAYYYIRISENVLDIPNRIEISYSDLLDNPLKVAGQIAQVFDLKPGSKTSQILKSIKPVKRNIDTNILDKISQELSKKVAFYSAQS